MCHKLVVKCNDKLKKCEVSVSDNIKSVLEWEKCVFPAIMKESESFIWRE